MRWHQPLTARPTALTLISPGPSPGCRPGRSKPSPITTWPGCPTRRQRRSFGLPLDWRLTAGFRRTVLSHLTEIGYGSTASYAVVAGLAGNPNAVRAAATACATNPLPVVVPCHRIIYSDGRIGRYLGGPDAKRALLTLEAAA